MSDIDIWDFMKEQNVKILSYVLGDRVFTAFDISDDCGVSLATAYRAIRMLLAYGLIHGSGSVFIKRNSRRRTNKYSSDVVGVNIQMWSNGRIKVHFLMRGPEDIIVNREVAW